MSLPEMALKEANDIASGIIFSLMNYHTVDGNQKSGEKTTWDGAKTLQIMG